MNLRHLALCASLGLAACSSVPTHYYTLVAPAGANPPTSVPGPPFQLQAVRIPVQVDQPALVVREDRGNLAILDNERWGAPLADELHDALAARLELEMGSRDLANMPKQAGQPLVTVRADVRRFDSLPGQYALLDTVWSVAVSGNAGTPRSLTCSSTLRVPAGNGLDNLVLAHQQAIGQLAKAIANTARGFANNPQQGCAR
ncbi:PqiC family protein [Pseudomonas typographi]|uniref:Membrane integrity-associated transporter subunit PqiC n=1 Tax=Pseudomonas typographi TaxID=2715964 RepID=A0ABR7Z8F9_9PSED|nr:PqiC family protein [Pseudomonas typographi]MBD1553875.1 membrane integrity-associated transporter subunit PqiC [Pseudomonas typographi]MBD1590050.1 membrane integrity-associated transporter subunit PqiC [Pseudomonas typographi]MBD1601710.1 membrane integrity-associated transporter subunit PqiC [Pseudomonas typographi]